ncbi:hypothetical protein [Amycolatopsis sp. CA-230715]|uniref:hypothetical protein n=1 Tax=Amycolatopsis sp. CA-230715 TaxID=2745196 RepID=UPI001C014561|nr:hypothetical protein [Amycolatopsis sp. CA-230715]QWF83873.1 hypothetical protein HUW46_07316 [Amycolatopsis sp. CA-230715]
MTLSRYSRPIAVLLTSGIVTLGFGPAATAAAETPSAVIAPAERTALQKIVTTANVDALIAAGDATTAQQLAPIRAALADADAQDIDIIGALKKLAKFAQPIIVQALRVGGPVAASVLETIGNLVAAIPGVGIGGPITQAVLKPIALLIKTGAPALADLIESIKIEGVAKDKAREILTDHLRQTEGLPEDSAKAFGAALAEIYAA